MIVLRAICGSWSAALVNAHFSKGGAALGFKSCRLFF